MARQEKMNKRILAAAKSGDVDTLQDCINKRAEVNCQDYYGETPLHWAAWSGSTKVVDLLLKSGASPSVVDNEGLTPLHRAAEEGRTKVVDLLIKSGASPSVVDNQGVTPLHKAAKWDRTELVDLLLKSGAKSIVDNEGVTPLHWAARSGSTKVVDLLLKSGASPSVVDNEGVTPLHRAAESGRTEVVDLLLESGASPSVVNNEGRTPYDVALGRPKDLLQKYMDMPSNTDEMVTQFPMMDTSDEIKELLSKGTFISYENCVYLGGACNVGKSTLASILIGEEIPQEWKSTDGLTIYFGRNGIDLKKKKMVPLEQGSDGDVLSKVLRGKPDMTQEKPDTTLYSGSDGDVLSNSKVLRGKPDMTQKKPDTVPQSTDQSNAPTSSLVPEKDDVNIKQKSLQNYKIATILGDIKEEIRKGTYKIEIAPSNLVDFGGQRSFDMTHQLFMRFKGTFVLMFNGQIDFSVPLKEYEEGETTEAILKHWVNSILSNCADDKDILPIIMFCATRSDYFKQKGLKEARKKKLIDELEKIFKDHKRQHRIIYNDIFFINGRDENDLEIDRLKSKLVEVAFKQESWGKRMPMAWVPLDLQMSELRMHNMNIISIEELITLNRRNEDLALTTDKEIKHFLNVQHLLGKILYFDQQGLDYFIIVQPQSLVNILRSFITAELFWPKDKELSSILCTLNETGQIAKQDLLKLWSQEEFHQHMPNDDFKEFIIQVLVHLDILVEPKHYRQEQESKVQSYLVPCIVIRKPPETDIKSADKMICLSYTLLKSSIPAALSFKLIGAAMSVWPLKEIEGCICLYHQAAILCIDGSNDLHILVKDDKVSVYLINKDTKHFITPNMASTVQECLTLTMTKVLDFYQRSFGKPLSTSEVSEAFEIEVGEWCTSGEDCYKSVRELKEKTEWTCKNNKKHETKYPLYWIFDKKQVVCKPGCRGLDVNVLELEPQDKHLFSLAMLISYDDCRSLAIKLGLPRNVWKDIKVSYERDIAVSKFLALYEWKKLKYRNTSRSSFQELSDALPDDYDTHLLCQVFRENVTVYDFANPALQETPEDDVLKDVAQKVGPCAMHLGIQLGLDMATIQNILFKYPNEMRLQILGVMDEWKISGQVKTILMLMKAFQMAEPTGYNFLREKYRVKDHKNEAGEKTSADGDGNL